MLILILYIVLWISLYYLEGTHDAWFTLETNEHPPAKDKVKANYYKGRWHVYDSYSYAIFHIGIALVFTLLKVGNSNIISYDFLFLSLSFVSIGVAIRMVAHDMFFDLGMKRKLFIVPTCQGHWDFWDCWIVKLNNLHPILPFFLRFAPITISVVVYLIYFI